MKAVRVHKPGGPEGMAYEDVPDPTAGAGQAVIKGLDCLRPRGMMVVYGQASGPVAPVDTALLSAKGCLYLTRVNLGTYTATRQELEERSGDIFHWVGSGQLKVHVFGEYPLAEAAKAQAALEHRETIGKVLLVP
jgi:NADPH:quinone reductase